MSYSSDSLYSYTPRNPKPPPKAMKTTPSSAAAAAPLSRESEQHRVQHGVKKEHRSTTGSSSSSREKKKSAQPDAPLSPTLQAFQVLAMALVAWLVATGGFKTVEWIQQHRKPFCDSGTGTTRPKITDNCIPCPENGSCWGGTLHCFAGFKRVGKSCVKDKEIDQTAEKLLRQVTDHVCQLAAQSVCDGARQPVWLTNQEAQTHLHELGLQEHLRLDDRSWQLVWEKMAMIGEDSIAKFNDLEGKFGFSCPSELIQAYKPVKCKIKEWMWANIFILIITFPVVLLGCSYIIKFSRRRRIRERAEQQYLQVCEALEERALQSRDMGEGEPWVVVSRLRDHILLPSERKSRALWRLVEGFVQEDSRIDQYQTKVKGEMKIVWEWQVEGALRTPNVRNKVSRKVQ